MSTQPSEGLGSRLATYRRMAGYSARELADLAGNGLTRGVIANIESGRKSDITVDQLIALSTALAVPPVALALPLETPNRLLGMTGGEAARVAVPVGEAMDWFQGVGSIFRTPNAVVSENPSTRFAEERIRRIREYEQLRTRILRLRSKVADGTVVPEALEESEEELAELTRILGQLEVDLTVPDGTSGQGDPIDA